MRLVILGGPGAGKGTQARRLCHQLGISEISTGDALRNAIASQTELGCQAQPYVEKGELVPDPILIEFMRQRLLQPDTHRGWLLEGYPRTAFQAEELDFLLEDLEQRLDWAIYLEVSESVMMNRSVWRSFPPPEPLPNLQIASSSAPNGFHQDRRSKVTLRPDDRPEIVERRIELFYERTIPILEYYGYRQRLLTIKGDQPPEQVQQEILRLLLTNR